MGPYVPLPWLDGIRSPAFVFPQAAHTRTGRAASTSSRRRISVSKLCRPTQHASGLLMPETLAMRSPWRYGQLRDNPARSRRLPQVLHRSDEEGAMLLEAAERITTRLTTIP